MQKKMSNGEIIIVGARGMGRELAGYLHAEGYNVKGFLDDSVLQSERENRYPVLGSPDSWEPKDSECFIVALGDAKWRRHYVELLSSRNARFATFISNRAYVGQGVCVGEGSIVAPTAVITSDVVLGKHCILNVHTSISHDCTVGDFVTLSPGSRIPGRCVLGDDVFLGVNAALVPDVKIAADTIIGAGAVVTKSFMEPGKTLAGVPARVL